MNSLACKTTLFKPFIPTDTFTVTNFSYKCAKLFTSYLGEMSTWDPMKEQYFSKRNAYSVDVNDPAVAMLGYGELFNLLHSIKLFIPSYSYIFVGYKRKL